MGTENFSTLKKQYPEHISLDQLCRICHIAKRSAKYLLDHGIIPYRDTGRKTHKYRIAMDDVISYLKLREQIGSMIPTGAVNSRRPPRKKTMSSLAFAENKPLATDYFIYLYSEFPDMLSPEHVAEMTGLSYANILSRLKDGTIHSIREDNRYHIPKTALIAFVTSPDYADIPTNSKIYQEIIGGFELWKTAKS